jgi:hypothetical protein
MEVVTGPDWRRQWSVGRERVPRLVREHDLPAAASWRTSRFARP